MFRYARLVLRICIRDYALYALIILLSASMLLPILFDEMVFGPEVFRMNYYSAVNAYEQNEAAGLLDELPADEKARSEEEIALANKALDSTNVATFLDATIAYERMQLEDYDMGALVGDRSYDQAVLDYCQSIRDNNIKVAISSSSEMPFIYALPYVLSLLPAIVWYTPAIIVSLAVCRICKRGRLLSRMPFSDCEKLLGEIASGVLLALAICTISMIPLAAVSTVCNGFGNLSYPIIEMHDGSLWYESAASCFAGTVGIFLTGNASLAIIALGIAHHLKWPSLGVVVPMVLIVVSMSAIYEGLVVSNPTATWMLPSSYFVPAVTCGYVGSFPTVSTIWLETAFSGQGTCILLAWAALAAGVSLLAMHAARLWTNGRSCGQFKEGGLSLENARLGYAKGRAVLHVDKFILLPGEICGLVAPNGYGKSTLFAALAGDTRVVCKGKPGADETRPIAHEQLAVKVYLSSNVSECLYRELDARGHVELVREAYQSGVNPERLLEKLDMKGFAGKRFGRMSDGMKQMTGLACACASQAEFLLLDEPMNALDPGRRKAVAAILRSLVRDGAGICLSSHLLEDLDALVERCYFIDGAELCECDESNQEGLGQLYEELYERS